MQLLIQNNCAVLVTQHQSLKSVSAFSFISIGHLFIHVDLSSSIERVAKHVAFEVATRKVFKIKEFAGTLLFLIYQ